MKSLLHSEKRLNQLQKNRTSQVVKWGTDAWRDARHNINDPIFETISVQKQKSDSLLKYQIYGFSNDKVLKMKMS